MNIWLSLTDPLQLTSIPCRDLENVEIWLHVPCILPLCIRYLDLDETSKFTDWQLKVMRPFYLKCLSLKPFWHVTKGNSIPCYGTAQINEKLLGPLIFIWNILTLLNVKGWKVIAKAVHRHCAFNIIICTKYSVQTQQLSYNISFTFRLIYLYIHHQLDYTSKKEIFTVAWVWDCEPYRYIVM